MRMDVLKVAVVRVEHFLDIRQNADGRWTKHGGPEFMLLDMLSQIIGFKYEIVYPDDGAWGYAKHGNWTGLIGMLVKQEADIAMALLSITEEREKVVDFSIPYFNDPITFFTKAPSMKSKASVFVHPYSLNVWLSIFLTLLFVLLVVQIVFNKSSAFSSTGVINGKVTFKETFWYLLGSLSTQGGRIQYYSMGKLRLLLSSWWLFVVVVAAGYSGSLLSFLMIPAREHPISTVENLRREVEEGRVTCGTMKGTLTYDKLTKAKRGELHALGKAMSSNEENLQETTNAGLQKVLKGKYIYIETKTPTIFEAYRIGNEFFYVSQDRLYSDFFAVAMRKGFHLRNQFNKVIKVVTESGLYEKWIIDTLFPILLKSQVSKSDQHIIRKIVLEDIQGAFFIWFIGLGIAMCLMIIENFVYYTYFNSKQQTRTFPKL